MKESRNQAEYIAPQLSDVDRILAAGMKMAGPVQVPGFSPVVFAPESAKAFHLQPEPLPEFISAVVRLDCMESFIGYVNRFKLADSSVFASPTKEIVARIDYHSPAIGPCRNAHSATYAAKFQPEAEAVLNGSGKAMQQIEFAEWIETNTPLIAFPDSADLLEMALNIEAKSSATFASKIERVSGSRVLAYNEQNEFGKDMPGKMKVPERIAFNVPVFDRKDARVFEGRMFYRIREGHLAIGYQLIRPEIVVKDAYETMLDRVREQTGLPVYLGVAGSK